ncbi:MULTISPECIES: hypothetical protein, partial [unclassified Methylobacterium]|uniref:hypothetical protein n=1 Tax=unclassified Methylobacterium TaxID=2615210 RepID=UPI001AEDA862
RQRLLQDVRRHVCLVGHASSFTFAAGNAAPLASSVRQNLAAPCMAHGLHGAGTRSARPFVTRPSYDISATQD